VSSTNRGGRGANAPTGDRATKAERKEQARLEREAIQRQIERKRKTRGLLFGGILALAIVALVAIVLTSRSEDMPPSSGELPGMMTSTAPWSNNVADLSERVDALGLSFGGHTQVALHHHTRLEIWVNGEQVQVPANVGWDDAGGVFAPMHTHDVDGVIHTESADPAFSADLGTVFDVWGLRLTDDCLGAYCAQDDKELRVFVDGQEVTGDPREIPVNDQSLIVVTYGSEDQLPDPMPSDFVPQP
jgi:hypothetical protein